MRHVKCQNKQMHVKTFQHFSKIEKLGSFFDFHTKRPKIQIWNSLGFFRKLDWNSSGILRDSLKFMEFQKKIQGRTLLLNYFPLGLWHWNKVGFVFLNNSRARIIRIVCACANNSISSRARTPRDNTVAFILGLRG